MSRIYEAFVYSAIGAVAYLVAGEVGGVAGVALAAAPAAPNDCEDAGCCNSPGSWVTCCGDESDFCLCKALPSGQECFYYVGTKKQTFYNQCTGPGC